MTDKDILKIYMEGFNDELLDKLDSRKINSNLDGKAYVMGSFDALHGDDVRSVDYQSDEEILKRIKNGVKK
jgi:hypothetical protein